MSSLSVDRKAPLDYGVQIRFIKDLQETGGVIQGGRIKGTSSSPGSKYGVAVRVQGVSGQPYVVLKEGEKGDSYGVQLKAPQSSLRNGKEEEEKWPQNPYASACEGQPLRRVRSQDSLLQGGAAVDLGAALSNRPLGDGRCGSSGNLTGGGPEQVEQSEGSVQNEEEEDAVFVSMDSFPDPPPPVDYEEDAVSTVDTNSLGPINKLISKFDSRGLVSPTKSRTGVQACVDGRKSASSLVATSCEQNASLPFLLSQPSPNPYTSLSTSSASSTGSLGRNSVALAKPAPSPFKPASRLASRPVAKQVQPAVNELQATPDLLRDQGQTVEILSEEDQRKQVIYSILREGSSETDSALKYKINQIFEKLQILGKAGADEALKAELEDCLDENMQLQERLDRKKAELHEAHTELTQLRMDKEEAEAGARILEDQRAGLQEDLRRLSEGNTQTEALQMELVSVQAALAEVTVLHQQQEETLWQRERELTALKGALKDEVATHDQEVESLREQYSHDIERLRSTMQEVTQSQFSIEAERERVNSTVQSLQQQLETSKNETNHWRAKFDSTKEELLSTKQELMQAQLDKDEFEEEMKDLQERLVAMKNQIPDISNTHSLHEDLKASLKQAELELEKKRSALACLEKSSQEQEAEMKREIDQLKDQLQKEKKELAKALEKTKQATEQPELGVVQLEANCLRDSLSSSERELQAHRDQLAAAQKDLLTQKETQQGLEESNVRLRERLSRLETQLQSSVSLSSETEQALEEQNHSLRAQLEESRRGIARLGQEREELMRRLEERDREREVLRRGKSDLEEQRRLLDRALEKLNKEMEQMSQDSRQGVQGLQGQLEELRERSRKDVLEAQRQARERLAELQRGQTSLKSLQEEVSRLKKELLVCSEERDSALLDKQLLSNRLKHMEEELEAERACLSERARDIRGVEDKVKTLELELDEEKGNVELLSERMNRSREQVDQLRSELMQERSSRQDLELDKSTLERQVKDVKAQLEDMRGPPRSTPAVSQLESRVQELEERLHSEEREKNSMQSAQRRMERKLKELNIALDEERHRYAEQRDQMALRMKALKRQLDESEGEVERLEGLRRKAVRDTEEHLEQQEVLQARVTALEAEIRRRVQQLRCTTLDSSTLSSEDEEGFFGTAMGMGPHLQNSSC